jgi:hypothetical protein
VHLRISEVVIFIGLLEVMIPVGKQQLLVILVGLKVHNSHCSYARKRPRSMVAGSENTN